MLAILPVSEVLELITLMLNLTKYKVRASMGDVGALLGQCRCGTIFWQFEERLAI